MALDRRSRSLLMAAIVVISLVGVGFGLTGSTAAQTADITVDAGGTGNYTSIQDAVDNATAGEMIEVTNGTYRESVTINKSITLVAGSGDVVLNGSTLSSGADAIQITDNSTVQPTIDGFQITGYEDGVDARETAGDWEIGNLTITNTTTGVSAFNSSGNWDVKEVTITDGFIGIDASSSTGSWTIEASTVRNASNAGIAAEEGTGNGTVFGTEVTNSSAGVEAYLSDTDLTIVESTFANNSVGVSAKSTSGGLVIEESTIQDNAVEGVNATGAAIEVDASYNYWGASDGPGGLYDGSGDEVFGEVDISPYYTDDTFTDTAGVDPDADPIINETGSSVTPATVSANETELYTVDVTVDNTTLTDESGEVDVAFENFRLEPLEDDLTINYTSSNISNGTLSVDGAVNATSPTDAGTYAVNLTEIRVDGAAEGPVENGDLTIDTIEVGSAADPVVNESASSVTPTNVTANESTTYAVNVTIDNTTLTDAEGDVTVVFENHSLDIDDDSLDGPEEDLKINYTSANLTDGTLSVSTTVSGTAPTTAGSYTINVTDLEVYTADGDEMLIQDANVTIATVNVTAAPTVDFQYDTDFAGTRFDDTGTRTTAEALQVAANGTNLTVGPDRSFRVSRPLTGESVLVTPNGTTTYNTSTARLDVYGPTGELSPEPRLRLQVGSEPVTVNASVTGDTGMFANDTFAAYTVELRDTGTVVGTTDAAIHGIGYHGSLGQNSTTGTVSVSLNRSQAINESWAVEYTIRNESGQVLAQPVENNASDDLFTTSFDASTLDNGTYDHEITIAPSADARLGERILSVNVFDDLTVGPTTSNAEPVVNTTASTVTPTNATANESQRYDLGVTIENTSLTDEHGEVDVAFENFTLDTGETDLSLNYTGSDIDNGTLSVTDSINATAPETAGAYAVTVTDLRVENTSESLLTDANVTIGVVDVAESTAVETVELQYDPFSAGARSDYDGTNRTTREELQIATVNETVFEFGYALNRSLRVVNPESGQSVVVTAESGNATYNVTAVGLDITEANGDIRSPPELDIETPTGSARINASVTGDTGMFENDTPFAPYTVELREDGTVLGATNPAIHGVGYNGSLAQNSTSGTIGVTFDRQPAVNESWTVTYRVQNDTGPVLSQEVTNADTDDVFTTTVNASTIATGTYDHSFTIAPSPDSSFGDRILSVAAFNDLSVEDDDTTSGGGGGSGGSSAPVINTTFSSVAPNATTVEETDSYSVGVVIDNTSLTDQHGEVDVAFENFTLETNEDDLTLNYTDSNIDNGTLAVSGAVNATAPNTTGIYAVNVTNLRVENTSSELTYDTNNTIGRVYVGEPVEPVVNTTASSVTPRTVVANETDEYTLNVTIDNTTLTDEHGEIDVRGAGTASDTTINFTGADISDGRISVSETGNATAPATPGTYPVNVTDLRVENTSETLIADANVTIGVVEVIEPVEPVVNASASSVTPTLVPANESEQFTVDVTIDNTSLTTESGEVDVAFEAFDLGLDDDSNETESEDLTINYTNTNISNGTLTVSESVTATAPGSTGVYNVSVTDLRIEGADDQDGSLIEDASERFGRIEVTASSPNTSDDSYSVAAGETLTVSEPGVLGNDTDPNGDSLTASLVRGPANGSLTLQDNGSFEYTPDDGFTGIDEFSYQATDPTGNAETATVTVSVTEAAVESLSATLAESSIPNGTNTSLTATATLTDGSTEQVTTEATLTATDTGVAQVDAETGTVTGVAEGSTTLTATYQGFDATATLSVGQAVPASLNVSIADERISSDSTTSLRTIATLTNGTVVDVTGEANYTSADTSVVTVDATGTVSGVSAGGPVTLTADYQGPTDSTTVSVEIPPLTVDRSAIEFGTVSLANSSVEQVTVRNNASTAVDLETARLTGSNPGEFSIQDNVTGEIPATTSRTINVSYAPSNRSSANATLNLTAADPALSPEDVRLSGTGTATDLTITANQSSIIAGEPVGFSVTDDEDRPVNATLELLDTVVRTGADGNATVRIDSVGTISVTASSDSTTTAYISDSVSITVTEPTLTVAESAIEFGSVSLGEVNRTTVTVVNNASTNISVGDAELFGADPGAFEVTEATVPSELAANSNATVEVGFRPTTRESVAASLELADNVVALDGTGVAPKANVTSELPIEITTEETGSANATVTVSNDGNAPLDASLTTGDDAFNHPDRIEIPADASETVDLQFDPGTDDSGTVSTDLTVATDSSAVENVSVPVVGTVLAREISLRQSDIEFGTTTVGEPVTTAVVVDNTGTTTETLSVTTSDSRFTVSGDDETITLGAGNSERLSIEANLSSPGTVSGTLRIQNDSATTVSDTASLNVTAEAPRLTVVDSEPVDLSDTPVNSTSTAEVELRNDGEATLSVGLDNAFGASESEFSVVGASAVDIPATESRNVTVGFTPANDGDATANLTLATNDLSATDAEENVSLNATGFKTDFQIAEGVSEFGAVGVGGSATGTLTIENNASSQLDITDVVTSNDEFSVSGVPDDGLDRKSNATLTVTFTPAANGSRTGSLQLTGNFTATEGTTTVSTPLAGTGRYGELGLSQRRLRTGVTATDSTTSGSVTVANAGLNGTSLTIDELTVADSQNFSVASGLTAGDVLAGGDSDRLAVTFDPSADATNGEQQTTLTLNASSGERTFNRTLRVSGIVSTPEPTVDPGTLSVGTVTVGDQTLRTVTVSNEGGEPFNITDVSTDDAGIDARQVGPSVIVPGGESTVAVAVNRSATGSFDSTVTVSTTDEDRTVDVTGTAVAPELTVTTGSVGFSDTGIGSASTGEFTVRNTGNASLTVSQPTITGADNTSFGLLSGDRQLRIAPGGSQTITVGFGPQTSGEAAATLQFRPLNDPTDTQGVREISLTGTGIEANATLNSSAVSFGDVEGNETRTQALTLTNDGTAPLQVTGTSLLGSDSGAFNVTGLGAPQLDANESQQFTVELNTTGRDRGGLSSQLVIGTDDTDVTSQLGATVIEPDIEIGSSVNAEQFGTTRLGTTSTATVAVNNTGNADLNLTNLSVSGADDAAFRIVETPANTTVAPQATGRVVIEFDPSAASNAVSRAQNTPLSASATLDVESNDPDSSEQRRSVSLSGQATTAAFQTPRTFQFGDVPIGETRTGQLTIRNTPSATTALNVTAIEVSGPDAGDYAATLNGSDTPTSLSAGETATIDISLTPSSFDQKYATLSVETDDTRQPVRKIGLSNTETTYSVTYGSVNVAFNNPTPGPEPTVNVDEGLRGRNATLRTVNSNVSSNNDYSLNYTFGSTPSDVGKTTALETDSETGANLTSIRYLNATTSASAGDFQDSTFQVEVSKAALATREVSPENVTIYHDDSGFEPLDTELLFETTQGYVYEATTDSYSVFAVGVPDKQIVESVDISLDDTSLVEGNQTTATVTATYDDGSSADVTSEATITSDDSSIASVSGATISADSAGSATIEASFDDQSDSVSLTVEAASDGTSDDSTDDSTDTTPSGSRSSDADDEPEEPAGDGPTIQDVVEQVGAQTPETEVDSEIVDSDPDRPGITVETEGTRTVRRVTFADEGVTGTVNVKEYGRPSAELSETIEQSVTADVGSASESGSRTTVRVRSVTDISPSSEAATQSAATIELTADSSEFDNPANAFVVHETDDGWERLETTVEERSDGEVTLSAETDSFSLFAIAEEETTTAQTDSGTDTDSQEETTSEQPDEDDSSTPILPLVGLVVVLAVAGVVVWISRNE